MIPTKVAQAICKAEKYPYIMRVGIFGSFVRDEETPASDIDIIIDYDNSSDDFLDDLDGLMEEIDAVAPCKVDYVTMAGLECSKNEAFRKNVLKDVKWVYLSANCGDCGVNPQ